MTGLTAFLSRRGPSRIRHAESGGQNGRRLPIPDRLVVALLAFCDYPRGHWVPLRTTNPIESTFASLVALVRVRSDLS